MKYLPEFKKQFDTALFSYLDLKAKTLKEIDPHGGEMVECIKEFISNGGKRFRPALFYFSFNSFNKKKSIDILKFSFIFELFHTFALIHDDIIDNAHLRRGNPTVHVKYGMEMGVLAGDFVLTLADELFMDIVFSFKLKAQEKKRITDLFNKYKQELLIGQYLDSKHLSSPQKIMLLKTAQYSFVCPVLFGLLLAGASQEKLVQWEEWMTGLGMVFQLKDDYEGVMGDDKKTGKSVASDTEEGKNTLIVELFKEKADRKELEKFQTFFGKHILTAVNFDWYKRVIQKKGIDSDIRLLIQNKCKDLNETLSENLGTQTALHKLSLEILERIQVI
ncbi:hypothetical protein COY90_02915 [Candidatus Roizmanbacteria bacterium CG_4_10_14_0_8_um_filter_39_9]|uniref:Polyprenyl synthetase family protein n=1 Tax=Candidatus Roizmanbacteria bacterium CG_4_10_14_0_8_um_filter_39_9 TaxID=1974829 RepID=A0A2M7QDJ6_9BACT|nr:MAG: hypothetical protein COY90_02915 [Candidatus Roizmanbacteria bacterium CG_4_10_14_0_8_um_filter_39_9]